MGIEIHCPFTRLAPVGELKQLFNPLNANEHPPEQVQELVEQFKWQGIRHPAIISTRTGKLIAGHGRILAAEALGMADYPVSDQPFESEAQEYSFLVADNEIARWSRVNLKKIHAALPNIEPFDIKRLGIRDFRFEPNPEKEGGVDAAPEPPAIARSKRGELWSLGDHRLLIDDCTKRENVERLLQGEKIRLWQSDPPYGINHVEVANEKGQAKGYAKIQNDELQDEALREFILSAINASLPSCEKGFAFYMWHAMKMQAYFSQAAAAAAGILFHRQIIWVKPQFVFGRGQYHWRHELCLMGWLQGNEPPFYGDRNQSTVWEIGRENDKIHPTQKPVALWEIPIHNHTHPGEVCYEPFAGSGGQFVAAELHQRRCFGMEIEPVYGDVILDRFQKHSGKVPVREDGKPWNEVKNGG